MGLLAPTRTLLHAKIETRSVSAETVRRRGPRLLSESFTFGDFVLDPLDRALRRGGAPVALRPKDVDVLLVLVERHGALVEKSALFDRVWPGVTVEECNLAQHVAALRRALGDDARVPAFIETVPRRGYRFVAAVGRAQRTAPTPPPLPPVVPVEVAPPSPPPPPPSPSPTPALSPPPLPAPAVAPLPGPAVAPRARATSRLRVAVGVLGLTVALLAGAHFRDDAARPARRGLAVLPVMDLTGERRHARLAEALTEALVSDLARAPGLEVRLAGGPGGDVRLEPASPYHARQVDVVVECAIVGDGDRLRVVVELLDARQDRLLWADVFESEPVAYPELEERVVQALVGRLTRADGPDAGAARAGRAAARPEYELARYFAARRTPQVVMESLEHFQAAVTLDPSWALARAGLAEALLLAAEHRVVPASLALARAEGEARRALTLDPQLAEAEATLAGVAAARWDFKAAEAGYRRAQELDPTLAVAHLRYSALLTVLDRHAEAIAQARAALDLEPRSPAAAVELAGAYEQAGLLEEAVAQARGVLRTAPRLASAYGVLGRALLAQGRAEEALFSFAEAVRVSDRNPVHLAALARLQAARGSHALARELLQELRRPGQGPAGSPLDVAEVQVALGETDGAFSTLERAVNDEVPWLAPAGSGQALARLHDDPRFGELVGRIRERQRARAAAVVPLAVPVRAN